ncbi:1-acyl-sn-glycerol-3-phosphate acyltransferase [Hanstruepera ponticola]|uniref:1-acyl-sn-glycerol-3-phosphate acyltransferase n=1 Tax=Hanstruepera ponticola TaxID=2042995 RepID=UPI001F348B75|nr:1-acyl-sn-glycerol-3-phosphate acyltransferase [Hanstruepera ponticola]
MKSLWLHLVRGYLRIGLFFYYRRFYVINKKAVPKTGPLVILSNHNNALMDALLIATRAGRFSYFLTRASVFKNPKVKTFLKSLNMLPVYRVRDGWSSIQENNAIFEYCRELLHKGKVVALFPEGNHNIKRTVRPLSKGFTRIIFETLDNYPDTNLKIIPIGLNYEEADAFADSVSMVIGDSLQANAFVTDNRNQNILNLKEKVSETIKTLTTHIPVEAYASHMEKLQQLKVDFLNPTAVNKCINSNYEDCSFKVNRRPETVKQIFKFLMLLALFVPYLVWRYAVKPRINEIEFVSTFRFAIAITLVPGWIFVVALILGVCFGGIAAFYFVLFTLATSLLAVKL